MKKMSILFSVSAYIIISFATPFAFASCTDVVLNGPKIDGVCNMDRNCTSGCIANSTSTPPGKGCVIDQNKPAVSDETACTHTCYCTEEAVLQ
jgi:hypothetical protein